MRFDRPLGQHELAGDGLVAQALSEQGKDLTLPLGEGFHENEIAVRGRGWRASTVRSRLRLRFGLSSHQRKKPPA